MPEVHIFLDNILRSFFCVVW